MRVRNRHAEGVLTEQPDSPTQPDASCASALGESHDKIRASTQALATRTGAASHPDLVDLYDAEMVRLSRHIAAVETFLYPLARHRLPSGRQVVADVQRRSRRVERVMRAIEGRLYGDVYAQTLSLEELHAEFRNLLEELEREELSLGHQLDATLPDWERDRLARRLRMAQEHGPTRPHPYTPHSRGLGRGAFWGWSIIDRAMDAMDNRYVPGRTLVQPRASLSRWDRYLLGAAQVPPARAPAAAPTSPAPSHPD